MKSRRALVSSILRPPPPLRHCGRMNEKSCRGKRTPPPLCCCAAQGRRRSFSATRFFVHPATVTKRRRGPKDRRNQSPPAFHLPNISPDRKSVLLGKELD